MNYASLEKLKEEIKNYAYSIGINKLGFTVAKPLENHFSRLLKRQSKSSVYSINEGDPAKRINPTLRFPEARSVVCAAIAYNGHDYNPHDYNPPVGRSPQSGCRGRLSFISRGRDYHKIMYDRLEKLKMYVTEKIPWADISIMVDKEEILEKAFAVEAGLGWFGKNTLLVIPELGSFVYLGELITNIPFPPDSPLENTCGNCERCLKACPTGALDRDKNLDTDLCLAGISQFKGLISHELRERMGNTLYGCDICQIVCPHNIKADKTQKSFKEWEPKDHSQADEHFPVLKELLFMTNSEFKKKFGHTSGAWRGRTVFQRNAAIAAGNNRDVESVPALTKILLNDTRPVMRATAAWALGKIDDPVGKQALRQALSNESDITVTSEIKRALESQN